MVANKDDPGPDALVEAPLVCTLEPVFHLCMVLAAWNGATETRSLNDQPRAPRRASSAARDSGPPAGAHGPTGGCHRGLAVVHDAEPSPTTAAGTCRARVYLGSVNRAWNFAARPLVSRSELPENFHGFAREPTWPQAGITVAIARSHDGSNAEPDERTATDTGANSIALGHRRRSR